jgi:hypothetical protein
LNHNDFYDRDHRPALASRHQGNRNGAKQAEIPRDRELCGGYSSEPAKNGKSTSMTRPRNQDYLRRAGDRGAADHPAISRIGLIVGTQPMTVGRVRFSDVKLAMKSPRRGGVDEARSA